MPNYKIENAGLSIQHFPHGEETLAVHPGTRRVLELNEIDDRKIERLRGQGVLISKAGNVKAQNKDPMPRAEEDLVRLRADLSNAHGDEREGVLAAFQKGTKTASTPAPAAKSSPASTDTAVTAPAPKAGA